MIFPLRKFVFALYVLLVAQTHYAMRAAEASNSAPTPFLIRSWQTEQGLPNNAVFAITQTHDNYLWLGTGSGLARFDGVNCRVFGLKDGLGSLQISALLEDRLGALWIGTAGGGLSRYVQGQIETFTLKDGLPGMSINALLEDGQGNIWVGTATGLSRWRAGKFESPFRNLSLTHIRDLAQDQQGGIWIATLYDGLRYVANGQVSTIPLPSQSQSLKKSLPDCLLVDHQNTLWVGMHDGTVLNLLTNHWTCFGAAENLPQFYINRLAETADGILWAGSWEDGLHYFANGKFKALRKSDGLSDDAIRSLFVDHEQNLWVGTRTGGLNRLSPKKISVQHVAQDSIEALPYSLAQTTNGELWAGTFGQGLFRWNGARFERFLIEPSVDFHRFVEALLASKDGSLWWGVSACLYQFKAGQVATRYEEKWLSGDRVLSLCDDRNGGIWVGTYNGQLRLLQADQFLAIPGLPGNPVTALTQEANGALWIGTDGGGLIRWDQGKLSVLTLKDGLPSNLIRALFLDADGTLWIGTDGGGLAHWTHGRLTTFTSEQGLPSDHILQITDDNYGCLWLGSDCGVWQINKQALSSTPQNKTVSVHPLVFGYSEGMPTEQCVGNFGAALKTATGKLYFATEKGIVVIDPQPLANLTVPPCVILEDVWVDEHKWKAPNGPTVQTARAKNETAKILPGNHSFNFYYTALDFSAPERIQFKYRLEGLSPAWTEVGKVRVARYSYLPPGQYRFQVTACGGDGQWNPVGADFAFVVLPHFWQTDWFIALSLLALCTGIGVSIRQLERRRYRARLKRLELEQATERERARIARDIHDELGSSLTHISMLSHFELSPDNSLDQLKKRLEKISNFAVRTARVLDEIVWAVNPRNDSLRSLLEYLTQFAREQFEDTSIRCRFEIADDLPEVLLTPEIRHHIFLTVKEAFNNSLKHARATEVSLNAKMRGTQIKISVWDNGTGFDPDLVQTKKRSGLANMRHRVENLGGQFALETAVNEGTLIQLMIDLPALSKS